MGETCGHQGPISRCTSVVPSELDSAGLCVLHFTLKVERSCADIHRQIALRNATHERQTEVAMYIGECSLALARIASSRCLSDEMKRRMLSTFLSLMNLRENLERAAVRPVPEPRAARTAILQAGPAIAS